MGFLSSFFGDAPEPDVGAMWKDFRRWQLEDEQAYERDLSREQSRMAAAGIAKDSDIWKQRISGVEAKREERAEKLQGSETYKYLRGTYGGHRRMQRDEALGIKPDLMRHSADYMTPELIVGRERWEKENPFTEEGMRDFFIERFGESEPGEYPTAPAPSADGRRRPGGSAQPLGSYWMTSV